MVVGAVTNMTEGSGDALLFRGGKFGQYQPIEIPHRSSKERIMSTRQETILKAWNGAWGTATCPPSSSSSHPVTSAGPSQAPKITPACRKTIEAMHTAFPDSTIEILQMVEDGDRVAIHWQTQGTHQGQFMDVPATGRSVTVSGASFLRFENDKLAEEWVVWDPRELLSALGIWHLGN